MVEILSPLPKYSNRVSVTSTDAKTRMESCLASWLNERLDKARHSSRVSRNTTLLDELLNEWCSLPSVFIKPFVLKAIGRIRNAIGANLSHWVHQSIWWYTHQKLTVIEDSQHIPGFSTESPNEKSQGAGLLAYSSYCDLPIRLGRMVWDGQWFRWTATLLRVYSCGDSSGFTPNSLLIQINQVMINLEPNANQR